MAFVVNSLDLCLCMWRGARKVTGANENRVEGVNPAASLVAPAPFALQLMACGYYTLIFGQVGGSSLYLHCMLYGSQISAELFMVIMIGSIALHSIKR